MMPCPAHARTLTLTAKTKQASQLGSRASGSEKMGLSSHSGPVPCQNGIEGERVGGEKRDGNISAHRGPPVKASRKSTQCLLSVPPYTTGGAAESIHPTTRKEKYIIEKTAGF